MKDNLPEKINWRGSVYHLESVEGDIVHWINPVSRHRATCSVASWKANKPYEDRIN